MLLITLYREGQMQRDKKRAEHEYNPNANLKKKNSAGQDTDSYFSSSF